jgi:hypothetical protein
MRVLFAVFKDENIDKIPGICKQLEGAVAFYCASDMMTAEAISDIRKHFVPPPTSVTVTDVGQ